MSKVLNKLTEAEQIKKKLSDKYWRMNNLYWIKDKSGKHIKFKFNWMQEILFNLLHNKNVILKVRQLGVTTFFCIYNLDDTLFPMVDSGFIAHRHEDAEKIFTSKIVYAWNFLPDWLKNEFTVDNSSTRMMRFTRKIDGKKSEIYVSLSLRSGTVQRLHITELATVDQYYPAKAEEIRTGALNAIAEDCKVSIESTWKIAAGVFSDISQQAFKNQKKGIELSKMDYRFFFFSWLDHPEYKLEGTFDIPRRLDNYFDNIEKISNITISQNKRNWYAKKDESHRREYEEGKTTSLMAQEFPTIPEEAFEAPVEGAYFTKEMELARTENRIKRIHWHKDIACETWWDIGKGEHMAIWVSQEIGDEIHFIDYITDEGVGTEKYAHILLHDKPYIYNRHNMPHDAEPTKECCGKSVMEIAQKIGLKPITIVPRISIRDGLNCVRLVFNRCYFDEERCKKGIEALKCYRREFDKHLNKFKDEPLKDINAHGADAFRTFAVGYRWRPTGKGSIYRPQRARQVGPLGY